MLAEPSRWYLPLRGADEDRAGGRAHAGGEVQHGRAGEVDEAEVVEPARSRPTCPRPARGPPASRTDATAAGKNRDRSASVPTSTPAASRTAVAWKKTTAARVGAHRPPEQQPAAEAEPVVVLLEQDRRAQRPERQRGRAEVEQASRRRAGGVLRAAQARSRTAPGPPARAAPRARAGSASPSVQLLPSVRGNARRSARSCNREFRPLRTGGSFARTRRVALSWSRMIRHTQGDAFLLITQHDHALLSGKFAERIGNAMFAPPSPFQETVDGHRAARLRLAGARRRGADAQRQGRAAARAGVADGVATRVWAESVKRAAAKEPVHRRCSSACT